MASQPVDERQDRQVLKETLLLAALAHPRLIIKGHSLTIFSHEARSGDRWMTHVAPDIAAQPGGSLHFRFGMHIEALLITGK